MIMGNSTHSLHQSSASERVEMNRSMRLHPMNRSSGPISFGFASLENSVAMMDTETMCSGPPSSASSGPPSLQNEFENLQPAADADPSATSPPSEVTSPVVPHVSTGRSTTKSEKRSANTLYQELSFQDDQLESEENEITGMVHSGEYASSGKTSSSLTTKTEITNSNFHLRCMIFLRTSKPYSINLQLTITSSVSVFI